MQRRGGFACPLKRGVTDAANSCPAVNVLVEPTLFRECRRMPSRDKRFRVWLSQNDMDPSDWFQLAGGMYMTVAITNMNSLGSQLGEQHVSKGCTVLRSHHE